MSILVRYKLSSADHHEVVIAAMETLTTSLNSESVDDVSYKGFSTPDPTEFIGVVEFDNEDGKQAFLRSAAFQAYLQSISSLLVNPPNTTEIYSVASTCS